MLQGVRLSVRSPYDRWDGLHLHWRFIGSRSGTVLEGKDREAGSIHYIMDSDPTITFTNLPPYRKVICRDVWARIDIVVQARGRSVEYEWSLHPGGVPEDIKLHCEGREDLRSDKDGELTVETAQGNLSYSQPYAYQVIKAETVSVACVYRIHSRGAGSKNVSFILPEGYDDTQELFIRIRSSW